MGRHNVLVKHRNIGLLMVNEQWAQLTFVRWRAVWCRSKSLYKMLLSQDGVAYGVYYVPK